MFITGIFAFIILVVLSCEYYTFRTGVPTSASFPSAIRRIIDILKAEAPLRSASTPFTIIDLGSGNGQLTRKIALRLPDTHVTGIEISFMPWLFSFLVQKVLGPKNLEYRRINFFTHDCSKADAIVTYLTENIMDRVSLKLRKELKSGAIVIANDVWLTSDWTPVETHDNNLLGLVTSKIYVYRQP